MNEDPILKIENLKTYFYTEAGVVKAVDGISIDVKNGESLGVVGESGSGKTVMSLSVLRIVPKPGRITGGDIIYKGESLLEKNEDEMRALRGSEIAIIFQDPNSSLNPVYSIETQLRDILMAHQKMTKDECRAKIIELLKLVGLPDPEKRMQEYPHQFSGGMKQRVAIARALACQPKLLFADEPTTALDVTIQSQVLDLLEDLKKKMGMTLVMITHDMGIIAKMTSRVMVLYAGQVCEVARTEELYEAPRHPYTEALLAAVPRLDMRKTLEVIPGNIPNLIEPPTGCRFHPRCKYVAERCAKEVPVQEEISPGHTVACWEARNIKLRGENIRAQ
jgi:peptide/nickel transport system ATP-binding protein